MIEACASYSLSYVLMGEGWGEGSFLQISSQYNTNMPDRRLIQFARELRRQSTDAERRIWSYLRAAKLCGYKIRRQHPIPPYIADFYCYEAKIVVELDGNQHGDPEAVIYDKIRTDFFARQGIQVIRFSDPDALKNSGAVAETILHEVERRLGKRPSP
jgi:very-short-patch-repair endonuclease